VKALLAIVTLVIYVACVIYVLQKDGIDKPASGYLGELLNPALKWLIIGCIMYMGWTLIMLVVHCLI